ncbi:unnamed protein product [Mytilus coruscus]|uniref:C2H2-type domain-containing protein n=1 Tax=Mytilus coruscus TaxID=42192 RepID=A0A6J7ZW67_MYTCO|nr:unnamed protein product [Mytilus coruscus]
MYTCLICYKEYKYKKNLIRHIKEHHAGLESCDCTENNCSSTFIRRGYLFNHLTTIHGIEEELARFWIIYDDEINDCAATDEHDEECENTSKYNDSCGTSDAESRHSSYDNISDCYKSDDQPIRVESRTPTVEDSTTDSMQSTSKSSEETQPFFWNGPATKILLAKIKRDDATQKGKNTEKKMRLCIAEELASYGYKFTCHFQKLGLKAVPPFQSKTSMPQAWHLPSRTEGLTPKTVDSLEISKFILQSINIYTLNLLITSQEVKITVEQPTEEVEIIVEQPTEVENIVEVPPSFRKCLLKTNVPEFKWNRST